MTEKTMRLYTANYNNQKTFGCIPTIKEAPYANFLFDPVKKHLALIGTLTKQDYIFVDKVDSNGFQEEISGQKANALTKQYGKELYPFKRERLIAEVTNEYLITEKEEIIELVERFCENAKTFDYMKYLDAEVAEVPNQIQMSPEQQMEKLNELVAGAKEHGAELKIVKEEQ